MAREEHEILEFLESVGACDVADGLSQINHEHGGYLEGIIMYSPEFQGGDTKVVGRAFTVKFVSSRETEAPKLSGNYIDMVPRKSVLFMSQPTPHLNAIFGGLMSLRALALGVNGVIVDGIARDLGEHRKLGIPLFCRSVGTTAANGVCRASEVNVPLTIQSKYQNVVVKPGDYIVADQNGVVCLPQELASKVLDVIPAKMAADEKCAEGIKNGRSVQDVFKEFR